MKEVNESTKTVSIEEQRLDYGPGVSACFIASEEESSDQEYIWKLQENIWKLEEKIWQLKRKNKKLKKKLNHYRRFS